MLDNGRVTPQVANPGAQRLAKLVSGMPPAFNGKPLDEPYGSLYAKVSAAEPGDRLDALEAELEQLDDSVAQSIWSEIFAADASQQSTSLPTSVSDGVGAAIQLTFRTAADLPAEHERQATWVVPGYLAAESITELTGKPKAAGKTTMLLNLARQIVTGGRFLGQQCSNVPVLYLTEERPATFREGLSRAALLGCDDLHILYWHDAVGLPWPEVVRQATDCAHACGAGVLIVDTIGQFVGFKGDQENNSGDALQAVQPLQGAAATGLAVVIVRHERKGGGEVGDAGRGSSAFSGAVDIVLSLRRAEGNAPTNRRVIHGLSRYSETPEKLVIELTPEGQYVALGAQEDVTFQETKEGLLAVVPGSEGEALTMDELLRAIAGDPGRSTVQRALKALEGTVQRVGEGKRGDPYRYWAPG